MQHDRPATPSDVKRQLRQESGFGCCFCGHPFIQYHHIVPWHEDNHFRPDDMMTACGQCHHLLTVKAIPVNDQRKAKANPKNIVDRDIKGKLYVTSSELVVKLGSGTAIATSNLLVIKNDIILSARLSKDDGRVLISAIIMDRVGSTIARLVDNEWSMLPGAVWDFEAYPRHATIRTGHGEIAYAVDTRNDEVLMQGKWFFAGYPVDFSPTHANVMGVTLKAFTSRYGQNYITLN